jgi:predicted ATPase
MMEESESSSCHQHTQSQLFLDWTSVETHLFEKHGYTQQLDDAYRRCRSRQENDDDVVRELILITGPPGVGKTGLALTLEEKAKRDEGFFCLGKLDQPTMETTAIETTITAHGPFVEVIIQVVNQAVQRGISCVRSLQTKLELMLDRSEIQALVESIPSLRKLTRQNLEMAPLEEHWRGLKGPEAEKRYMHIFAKLIKSLSSPEHPLVILIDDLQWADRTSLELLKLLATDQLLSPGLLIACTARWQEKESEVLPMSSALSDMKKAGVVIAEIQISNMNEATVNDLVAHLLQLSTEATKPLAKVLYDHTEGNLFFVVQLLNVLYGDGLLHSSDTNSGTWTWDEDSVMQVLSNDQTVLDFLSIRLLQLADFEQQLLKTAACIGGSIYECLLEETVFPSSSVRQALETAKKHRLIAFDFQSGSGRFLHDRIQEAAYSLIPEDSRTARHLDIGRRLWIWLRPTELDVHLFTVANQIIRGLHLLDDSIEKEELAAFMLRAGRKAALLSSFYVAARYFAVGIRLLGRSRWKEQYDVCLALFTAAAEVEYYNGNLIRVDKLLASIFKHAKTLDDQMCARFTQIYSLGSRDDMKQALSVGLDVLKSLGQAFPRIQWKISATAAIERCRRVLSNMSDDDIMSLKMMTDKQRLVVIRLLNTIFVVALPTKEELLPFIVVRLIEQTLLHGISAMCKFASWGVKKLAIRAFNLFVNVSPFL